MISKGNSKVAVPCWNLPARETCKKWASCREFCYACRGNWTFPNVKAALRGNLLETHSDRFVRVTADDINRTKCKYFRIHASGDFCDHRGEFRSHYFKDWTRIAIRCPSVKFLAFTKCSVDIIHSGIAVPDNMTIRHSIDGLNVGKGFHVGVKLPYPIAGETLVTSDGVTTCPNQLDKTKRCGVDCVKCWKRSAYLVKFKKH